MTPVDYFVAGVFSILIFLYLVNVCWDWWEIRSNAREIERLRVCQANRAEIIAARTSQWRVSLKITGVTDQFVQLFQISHELSDGAILGGWCMPAEEKARKFANDAIKNGGRGPDNVYYPAHRIHAAHVEKVW